MHQQLSPESQTTATAEGMYNTNGQLPVEITVELVNDAHFKSPKP